MISIGTALADAARALAAVGVPEARRDAQVLLGHVLGAGREVVIGHPERPISAEQLDRLKAAVERRRAREPVAYILGRREFWGLEFAVSGDTLIPRPDSEVVVEAALATVADRRARLTVLDLGVGSGCLLLALLSELPEAVGVGVDIGAGALAVARANARRLGLAGRAQFARSDWGQAIGGAWDLIVANPPYVEAAEFDGLAPEITRFEPRAALIGGADPLASYRALAPHVARLLGPEGMAIIELGAGQAERVTAIMADHGLVELGRRRDLSGIDRCLLVCRGGVKTHDMKKITWNGRQG